MVKGLTEKDTYTVEIHGSKPIVVKGLTERRTMLLLAHTIQNQ